MVYCEPAALNYQVNFRLRSYCQTSSLLPCFLPSYCQQESDEYDFLVSCYILLQRMHEQVLQDLDVFISYRSLSEATTAASFIPSITRAHLAGESCSKLCLQLRSQCGWHLNSPDLGEILNVTLLNHAQRSHLVACGGAWIRWCVFAGDFSTPCIA